MVVLWEAVPGSPALSQPPSLGRVVQGLARGTLAWGRKCDLRMFVLNTLASFTAWYHR